MIQRDRSNRGLPFYDRGTRRTLSDAVSFDVSTLIKQFVKVILRLRLVPVGYMRTPEVDSTKAFDRL